MTTATPPLPGISDAQLREGLAELDALDGGAAGWLTRRALPPGRYPVETYAMIFEDTEWGDIWADHELWTSTLAAQMQDDGYLRVTDGISVGFCDDARTIETGRKGRRWRAEVRAIAVPAGERFTDSNGIEHLVETFGHANHLPRSLLEDEPALCSFFAMQADSHGFRLLDRTPTVRERSAAWPPPGIEPADVPPMHLLEARAVRTEQLPDVGHGPCEDCLPDAFLWHRFMEWLRR